MGDKSWRASSNGPDWTDIISVMNAIEKLHLVAVTVALHCSAHEYPTMIWHIAGVEVGRDASVMGAPILALSGEWPCKDHAQVTACLYAGLLRFDHLLSHKLWEQNKLPFTAE